MFPNMVSDVTFPSHNLGIWQITTHLIAGQSEHTVLFQTMSFVKMYTFQKGWEEKNNNYVRYEENNVYFEC